jgi:hypothetical protein
LTDTASLSLSTIREQFGDALYLDSFVVAGAAYFLLRGQPGKQLAIIGQPSSPQVAPFHGEAQAFRDGYTLLLCPTDHANAAALRRALPWLTPTRLGLATSAGCGDRLGLATPGHVQAMRRVDSTATILPIFAQQSIREMERTHRTPDDVLADATWGTFQAGWRGPVGADADHIKTPADIDVCVTAGFTFFTIDPGAHVDGEADAASPAVTQEKVAGLPWADLASSPADLETRYVGRRVDLDHQGIDLDRGAVLRAAAKYGRAIAHVTRMVRHLVAKGILFELEVSVDETDTPTSLVEHIYIASELQRLGVQWVSLAPRYVGRFEKGIDYIGDLSALAESLAGHAAIARALGPYKLSLHSGSDKFSVYPLIAAAARGLVHLKTAGTSYLEALRVIAGVEPALFRQIATLARERYPQDKASYHVSADLARVPEITTLADAALPALLDDRDARQVLHVTFGSALAQFKPPIMSTLAAPEAEHYAALERHFLRHLEPLAAKVGQD